MKHENERATAIEATDVFTKEKRSAVMARIRGKGNRDTELRMIALFRAHRITGWRRGQALFGKPDFTFRKERVIVFVDGCFWHGCPKPKHAPAPKTRAEFWAVKLGRNKERDREVTRFLTRAGWKVIRVWECDLATKHWTRVARRLFRALGRTALGGAADQPVALRYGVAASAGRVPGCRSGLKNSGRLAGAGAEPPEGGTPDP